MLLDNLQRLYAVSVNLAVKNKSSLLDRHVKKTVTCPLPNLRIYYFVSEYNFYHMYLIYIKIYYTYIYYLQLQISKCGTNKSL